jgi:hypothetical protein
VVIRHIIPEGFELSLIRSRPGAVAGSSTIDVRPDKPRIEVKKSD